MKKAICFATLFTGCATYSEMMVRPSGEVRQCSATGQGIFGMETAKNATKKCVEDLRSVGYLSIDEAGAIGVRVNGTRVVFVSENGPAAEAGIQESDVITHVDGKAVTDETINLEMWGRAGEPVALTIERGGESIETRIVRTSFRAVNSSALNP